MRTPRQLEQLETPWRDLHFQQALALARQAGPERFVEVLNRYVPVAQRGPTPEEDLVAVDLSLLTKDELYLLAKAGGFVP